MKLNMGFKKRFYSLYCYSLCTFRNMNENHFTGLTLLNLQKAFDTAPRDILLGLAKLKQYGIRGHFNL